MDGIEPKAFGERVEGKDDEFAGEARKKSNRKNRKFIDLQKQPPRPKSLVIEE